MTIMVGQILRLCLRMIPTSRDLAFGSAERGSEGEIEGIFIGRLRGGLFVVRICSFLYWQIMESWLDVRKS